MENNNEQIQRAIESLPIEFQESIANSFVSNKVLDISKKHGLLIDQSSVLMDHTMLSLLGLEDGNKFTESISNLLNIPSEKASLIVKDINEQIFEEIKKKIIERTSREGEEDEEYEEEDVIEPETEPIIINRGAIEHEGEMINRDEILSAIEETPVIKKETPTQSIPEQKLAGSFKVGASESLEKERTLASIKKADPYRESV